MDSWDVHPTGNTYFCKHGTSFGTQHENSFWAFCGLAKTTTWCGCLGRISPFDTVPSVHRYLLFTVKHSGSYPANILKPPVLLCIHRSEQRLYVYTTMCVRHAQKVCCFTYIKRCFIVTRTCQLWGYWHCQTGCCLASGCWSWTLVSFRFMSTNTCGLRDALLSLRDRSPLDFPCFDPCLMDCWLSFSTLSNGQRQRSQRGFSLVFQVMFVHLLRGCDSDSYIYGKSQFIVNFPMKNGDFP